MNHFIKSVKLNTNKAFNWLTIEYLEQINLIVGKNNVGKTTLLTEILDSTANETPIEYLTSSGLTDEVLLKLLQRINRQSHSKLDEVTKALQEIVPDTSHYLKNNTTPLASGERQIFSLVLTMFQIENGILLVDNIENCGDLYSELLHNITSKL